MYIRDQLASLVHLSATLENIPLLSPKQEDLFHSLLRGSQSIELRQTWERADFVLGLSLTVDGPSW